MYETYFSLNDRPFSAIPRADHYFPALAIEAARTTLVRCIDRAEGVALIVGSAGTGKSLLCAVLAEQFHAHFQIALLTGGHLDTRRALLQAVLYELGQPYRGMDEGELRLALVDHVTLGEDCGRGVLLLVDESHQLPLRLLDEIRSMTNLMRNHQPAVRLVMAGTHALEERFASPRLESLCQRVSARCYLEAFTLSETQAYIHRRIESSGGRGLEIFPVDACQMVHKATDGVPRLVNQLCDHVLLLAQTSGLRRITPHHIEESWADLQQLPAPWSDTPRAPTEAVFEFGQLDDDVAGDTDDNSAPIADANIEMGRPRFRLADLPDDDLPDDDLGNDGLLKDLSELQPDSTGSYDKLGQIQRLISDVQSEFRPKIATPENELNFDDGFDPFGEDFAEEELIADRFAGIDLAAPTVAQPYRSQPAAQVPAPEVPAATSAAMPERSPVQTAPVQTLPVQPAASGAGIATLPATVFTSISAVVEAPAAANTSASWIVSNTALMPHFELPAVLLEKPNEPSPAASPVVIAGLEALPAPTPAPAAPTKPAMGNARKAVAAQASSQAQSITPLVRPQLVQRAAEIDREMIAKLGNLEPEPPRPARVLSPRPEFGQLFGKLRRSS